MDDVETSAFVVVVSADAEPREPGVGWTGLVTAVESVARRRPGYDGATWLAQGRVLGPPTASSHGELLTGLLSWRSSGDAEAFVAELRRTRPVDDLVVDDGTYRLSAVVTASPGDVTRTDRAGDRSEPVDEIIRMVPVSGKQEWVGEYNESETREHISRLDGFVSASFFRDLRSDRILEHVRWRSADDLTAAFGDARFAEHLSVNSHYSAGEAHLFGERLAGGTEAGARGRAVITEARGADRDPGRIA